MANSKLRAMVISAAMAALALVLPVVFHMVGMGSKFLPMLLPLLLNGFLVPLPWAVLTGALVPLISSLTTGMPPLYPPVAAEMALEGAVLGGVASAIFRGKLGRLWLALIGAIVAGRLTGFAAAWVLARIFGLPAAFASIAMLVQGLPGVVLQLAVVPLAVRQLQRSRNILVERNDSET
jgi:uncharacterized membrane protein YuzA (DUF378 family)